MLDPCSREAASAGGWHNPRVFHIEPDMPSYALNPSDFLLLQSETCGPEELYSYFRAHPNSRPLDTWLLNQARLGTPRGQLLLRSARAAFSFREDQANGVLHVLIGFPVAVDQGSRIDANHVKKARVELEAGVLRALGVPVALDTLPVDATTLHQLGATGWARVLEAFLKSMEAGEDAPVFSSPSASCPAGPAVWLGMLTAPLERRAELESLLFRMNPDVTRKTRPLLMRVEGLMEEQGAQVRLFPPTAAWNAPSFARLAHARFLVSRFSGPGWSLNPAPAGLLLKGPAGQQLTLEFPEETQADLKPLMSWFDAKQAA